MKVIDQGVYDNWKSVNRDDPYGLAIFHYAETWAELMEEAIENGESLEVCAKPLSRAADTDGITGFMYGAAVVVLAKCWAHGEALRRWHNLATQLHDEGERANESGGVLNPAMLKTT